MQSSLHGICIWHPVLAGNSWPRRHLSCLTAAKAAKIHRVLTSVSVCSAVQALEEKKLPAPIQPKISKPLDTSNFDVFDNVDPPAFAAGKADRNAHVWNELWDWIEEQPQ